MANAWIGGIVFMKKRSKINILFTVWLTVLLSAWLADNAVFAVHQENEIWSFDFKNCSFSDALDQVSRVTGIEILTNQQTDKSRFSKSFKDQTIDKILEDLFRRKSHAIMWRYGDDGLAAIDIWVFEEGENPGGFEPGNFINYKSADAKSNLKKKSAESSKAFMRGANSSDHRKYASFDETPKKNEQQTEKTIRNQRNKNLNERGGSRSRNLQESVSNQGDDSGVTVLPSPSQELNHQGGSASNSETTDVEQDNTASVPPAPTLEKGYGLEPPPMPPGFSYN